MSRRGGLIGIGFFSYFICGMDVKYIVKAMQYVKNLLGNCDIIALGKFIIFYFFLFLIFLRF
jgi:microsomal dipeptidase-like Zn-dependent dipeptidase